MTHQDLELLQTFQEQTVVAVRAPEETKMEIPVPTKVSTDMDIYLIRFYLNLFYIVEFVLQDSIQVHLKASQGPITILTCELGPSRTMETSTCFLGLEESRIRTKTHTPGLELLLVYWLFLPKSKNATFWMNVSMVTTQIGSYRV